MSMFVFATPVYVPETAVTTAPVQQVVSPSPFHCIPRPACLDAKPHCMIAINPSLLCPSPTPTPTIIKNITPVVNTVSTTIPTTTTETKKSVSFLSFLKNTFLQLLLFFRK